MKKKNICYMLFFLVLLVMSGCNKDTNKEPNVVPDIVKSLNVKGINNRCQSNKNYMEITSFDILAVETDEETQMLENGTYVVLGLNTDLPSDKLNSFKNDGNDSEIQLYGPTNGCKLNYYNYDSETKKIYFKFDETKDTVNSSIFNLKITNRNDYSFPLLFITFGCFNNCFVDGEFYYYIYFYLPLEY